MVRTAEDLLQIVIDGISPGEDGAFVVSSQAIGQVEQELAAVEHNDILVKWVAELCIFAGWVDKERKSPAVKNALLDAAATAIPRLKDMATEQASALVAALQDRAGDFAALTGHVEHKLNPQAAPDGSVRANVYARFDLASKDIKKEK